MDERSEAEPEEALPEWSGEHEGPRPLAAPLVKNVGRVAERQTRRT
jgi:hypothetical protein